MDKNCAISLWQRPIREVINIMVEPVNIMVRVGVIGCGYWGPNLIRNLLKVPGCRVVAIADERSDRLQAVRHLSGQMKTTTETRSEERRVGKGGDHGGRRSTKKKKRCESVEST